MRRVVLSWSPKQLIANHEKIKDPPPCVYGHFGCSCIKEKGGPCLDEQWSKIEADKLKENS